MSYKTYNEQLIEHLTFLRGHGFDISELKIDAGFVRCITNGSKGRGEVVYKTTSIDLDNGMIGLATWCRGIDGCFNFQTYSLPPRGDEVLTAATPVAMPLIDSDSHEAAARRAYGFWIHSNEQGESDYLKRKGVGAYGIRFRSSAEYGNVAVVPMRDISGRLWSYQILNADGTKRHPKGARTQGLFHSLRPIINGELFGIAEGYVTAATCMEATQIPCACCFSASNLKAVTLALADAYPASSIVIFADNDRHLEHNQGVLKAREVQSVAADRITLAIPDFDDIAPCKQASDWNDLVRLKGFEAAKEQIDPKIKSKNAKIHA